MLQEASNTAKKRQRDFEVEKDENDEGFSIKNESSEEKNSIEEENGEEEEEEEEPVRKKFKKKENSHKNYIYQEFCAGDITNQVALKLAVVGSRSIEDYNKTWSIINESIKKIEKTTGAFVHTIVSGGAAGVDESAEGFAKWERYRFECHRPSKERIKSGDKSAYLERSKDIVDNSDFVLVIWDGKSKGTKYTMNLARKKKKTSTQPNANYGEYVDDLIFTLKEDDDK